MNDVKVKQQIVDKIKASTNILVTVSNDPSVDALSAALGLTLMLNKVGKHATAVFSGAIPPAITFLDPEKTFEATTDSLQDFIIALDKEKADHLRYKVEGDVVKIFITPYRTTITSDDLQFSQGDYNVELVLALGVDNQDHLDGALEAQGRILHDATVATMSAGDQASTLGSLDWHESGASSLSEMLVGLAELIKTDKDKDPLLDAQTATALLTGIVAETDRFSNTKTSSKVMTVAAQLMAAGADQQLIAAKLEESHEIGTDAAPLEPTSIKIEKKVDDAPVELTDTMSIIHTQGQTLEDIANQVHEHDQAAAAATAQQAVADLPKPVETPALEEPELPSISVTNAYAPEAEVGAAESQPVTGEPSLGGTLSATTEQAAEDARKAEENDQNKTILSHAYLSESPTNSSPMNSETVPPDAPSNDIFAPTPEVTPLSTPTDALVPPSELLGETRDDATRQDALAAVHATFESAPAPAPTTSPAFSPVPGVTLPPPPPLPDFSTMSATSAYAPEPMPTPAPEILGDIFPDPQAPQAPAATGPSDPAQFKIPGQ
jgi:nanoRNase/pAp phosphatase (c-di-AMP/oligoRNAs hydrolase)